MELKKYDWSKHLFRASSFGNLMAGAKDLTDKQKLDLKDLSLKQKTEKGLTDPQLKKLNDLIFKRDNLELSSGAKTYLRKLRREVKFKRRVSLESKYLTKGIQLEEQAIDWLSIYHDTLFKNNKERKEDEYFTGECDIEEGYDTKVSWSLDTLPDVEEKLKSIYEYQNRVYMMLWDKKKWTTSSIVLSMLKDEIKKVLYGEAWKWTDNEIPTHRKVELIKLYCYEEKYFIEMLIENDIHVNIESDEKTIEMFNDFIEIPMKERIVEKTIVRDKAIEKKMINIVKLSRKYLQDIENEMFALK